MIIGGIISLVAAYYSLKKEIDQTKNKYIEMENLMKKLEIDLYDQLDEVKHNQVKNNDAVISRINDISKELVTLSRHFAELTGFLKGKDIK